MGCAGGSVTSRWKGRLVNGPEGTIRRLRLEAITSDTGARRMP
jgi:hypothetical protein